MNLVTFAGRLRAMAPSLLETLTVTPPRLPAPWPSGSSEDNARTFRADRSFQHFHQFVAHPR